MTIDWTYAAVIAFVIDWVIKIGFLLYIPRTRKPSAAIAWLLVIFLVPWLGIALYLFIGSPKLSRRRREIQKEVDGIIAASARDYDDELTDMPPTAQDRISTVAALNLALGKLPVRAGNSVVILPEYDKAIDDIVEEIEQSEEFVHLEYFIITLDKTTLPVFEALERAIKRGVKVRVLFDTIGYSRFPRHKEMKKLLTSIGAEWYAMLPFKLSWKKYNRLDLRNHRKIVVIDDRVAYIGSQNLIDRGYHRKDGIYYDELSAKLTGPIVRQCSVIFASDWYAETGEILSKIADPRLRPLPKKTGAIHAQIVPGGPGYETGNISSLITHLLHTAHTKIVITNPYFVPDEALLAAITTAARRGVEVILINSKAMDQWMVGHAQRSYYAELIAAGVQIYLYKHPVLLHSKHMTIDDDIAVIGSSNMDIRSFELDLECVLITYDASVVSDLNHIQKIDLSHCDPVNLTKWNQRGILDTFRDSLARLMASLL